MSLHFAASEEYINHGTGASINNLDNQTWIFWVNPAAVTGSGQRLLYKGGIVIINVNNAFTIDGNFHYFRARATDFSAVRPSAALVTANEWQILAVIDGDGVTPRIYRGTLSSAIAEIGAYGEQSVGSGAPTDDSADFLAIGARITVNTQSNWRIAYTWAYNRVLSLAEIRQHQFKPSTILSGCVLKTAYFNTTFIKDLSGNGNHGTVNNTPDLFAQPPLAAPFGFDEYASYVVAAPPAGNTRRYSLSLLGVG